MTSTKDNIDYLAELIVSHLIARNEADDSRIYTHYLGVFKRFFSRDIEKIEMHRNNIGEKEWTIYLNREGIYDLLPEGFFHSSSNKYFKDRKDTIEEFRRHRREEKNARLFFMPIEQEFFKLIVNKEVFEQNFYYSPETVQEFIDFFDLNHLVLNTYQKAVLFFILPHISKIAGNLKLTETCFEILLQEHVKINTLYQSSNSATYTHTYILGENLLGINSLIGNRLIDHNPQIIIEIGPLINSNLLISYISGMNLEIINRLVELFIQADLASQIKVFLNREDEMFLLEEKDYQSRLSYSTTI